MAAEGVMSWWECWCWPDRVANFNAKAATAEVLVGPDRLKFVEREVVFIYTDRAMLARIVASTDAVAEIRLGRDSSEERRVGKACVSTCRSRWSPYHSHKNQPHINLTYHESK